MWRDTADLWPGEDWRMKIRHAITDNALVFIACFSSQSAARTKSYQNEELALAVDQLRLRRPDDPWLIPVRLGDSPVPDLDLGGGRTLASIQRADLFGEHRDAGTTRLLITVQRLLGQRPYEPHLEALITPRQAPADTVLKASQVLTVQDTSLTTAEVAVQRLKQTLPDPTRRVEVSDLIDREIQQLASRIADTTRHPLGGMPFC